MKQILLSLLLLFPMVSFSQGIQDLQGMNEDDMQMMMQQMQKMGECMQDIDEAELKSLEQRSRDFEAELKSLCKAGKRAEAQKKAMAFGRQVSSDPTVKTMRRCGEMMKGAMPDMPSMEEYEDDFDSHVCDGM